MSGLARLQGAEEQLRRRAAEATPGAWESSGDSIWGRDAHGDIHVASATLGVDDRADAAYIALVSPPVALAVADWLAEAIRDTKFVEAANARTEERAKRTGGDGHTWVAQSRWISEAHKVADAILGPEATA